MAEKTLTQKCGYYNGWGRCAFYDQSKCVHDKGNVPFPYVCKVEIRMEEMAMREE